MVKKEDNMHKVCVKLTIRDVLSSEKGKHYSLWGGSVLGNFTKQYCFCWKSMVNIKIFLRCAIRRFYHIWCLFSSLWDHLRDAARYSKVFTRLVLIDICRKGMVCLLEYTLCNILKNYQLTCKHRFPFSSFSQAWFNWEHIGRLALNHIYNEWRWGWLFFNVYREWKVYSSTDSIFVFNIFSVYA